MFQGGEMSLREGEGQGKEMIIFILFPVPAHPLNPEIVAWT